MTNIILNTADAQQDGLIPDFTSSVIGSLQEFFNGDKSIAAMVRPVIPSTDGNALFPWEADYVSTDVIYFQIGEENAKATGGTFTLTYNAGTTSALAYNVTAAALETALEALSTGGVTVTLLSEGVYQVDWNSVGVIAPPITSDADLLQPACEIIVTVTNVGSASEKEQRVIEIRQAPVVSSTIDTVFTPTGVSATQKSANSATQNAIYEINLGDAYAGEYTVSLTANGVTTIVVLSAEMESDAIGIALAAHPEIYYQDVTKPDNIAVSKNGALITVQFIGTLGGTQSVRTLTGNTAANPSVVTSTAHKLKTGDSIVVSGSDSTPTIDGTRTVTVISENSFSVPVNVTVAGTTGSFYATTQPAIAYGSDLSLKTPKGFTGTINLNTVALAKAFWATEADELTYPAQFKRVRASGEERIIYGSTVTLKRQLINSGVVVPEIADGTLVIANGKTFTVNNTLTLAGTDGTTHTFPTTSATLARTDASQTFTGDQFFSDSVIAIIGLSVGSASAIDGQIQIFNETNSFYVSINASNATAGNQTWVFPDLLGSTDVFVGRDLAQTLTNKSISGASNTITNVSLTTGVTGTLPIANGGTNATSAPVAIANLGLTQPSAFDGLALWMDANMLKLQGSAEMADGTAIDAWRSRAKLPFNSADAEFTATSTARPLYKQNVQNSLPGVLFDGSNDLMTGPSAWSNIMCRNERTIFIVCKPTALVATGSGINYQRPQLIGTLGQYDGIAVSPSGSDNIFTAWDYDAASVRTASTGVSTVSSMALIESWHQDGVLSISLNEAAAVTTTLREITVSGSTIQMGTSGSAAFYTGYIFEVLIYSRALGIIERDAVADYLRAKWNF